MVQSSSGKTTWNLGEINQKTKQINLPSFYIKILFHRSLNMDQISEPKSECIKSLKTASHGYRLNFGTDHEHISLRFVSNFSGQSG